METKNIYFLIGLLLFSHAFGIQNIRKENDSNFVEIKESSESQLSAAEQEAKTRALKFYPNFKFHEDEKYFPQSIESFNINWSGVAMYDKTEHVEFGNYKGTTYKSNAPIYVSYKKNSDNSFYLTYVLLFPYNGCGAKLYCKVKLLGKKIYDDHYGVCPRGEHYLDKQTVQMKFNSSEQVQTIDITYHESWWNLTKNDLSWDGNHPQIYLAKGSHASYKSSANTKYKNLYKNSANGGDNSVEMDLIDNTSNNGKYFTSSNIRLLKYGGAEATGISNEERCFGFTYYGKMGKYVSYNIAETDAYKAMRAIGNAVKKVKKNWGNNILDAADEFKGDNTQGNPGNGVADKSFWKDY